MKQKRRSENVFTKLSYVFIVLMLTVFLFWFNSSGYGGITEAKLTMFNTICGGYVILTLILIPASLQGVYKGKHMGAAPAAYLPAADGRVGTPVAVQKRDLGRYFTI